MSTLLVASLIVFVILIVIVILSFVGRRSNERYLDRAEMPRSRKSTIDTVIPAKPPRPIFTLKWLKRYFGLRKKITEHSNDERQLTDLYDTIISIGAGNLKSVQDLDATVFSPRQVSRNSQFLIQVFIHLDGEEIKLNEIAKAADGAATKRISQPLLRPVEIGENIDLFLIMDDLRVDPSSMRIRWTGKINQAVFEVSLPADYKNDYVIGRVIVSIKTVPIGTIRFKIEIVKHSIQTTNSEYEQDFMLHFTQAFISYCSKDRPEVLKRVQMLNTLKCKYFQDLLSLEAGDKWEKTIYKNLKDSDVVFLMWSQAASESPWVKKEILYALDLQKENNVEAPEIIPVIIEGPPPAKPPEELKFLHFNDKFMYFINSPTTRS